MLPGETSVSAQEVDVEVVSTTKGSSTKNARRSSLQALEDDLTNGGLDMTPSQMYEMVDIYNNPNSENVFNKVRCDALCRFGGSQLKI